MKSLSKSVDLDRIFKILKEEGVIGPKISSFEEVPFIYQNLPRKIQMDIRVELEFMKF